MQNKVSGKPYAGEWAKKILRNDENKRLTQWLAGFQRETLLWAAQMMCWKCNSDHADKYPLDPSGSYHVSDELTNGVQPCEGSKLRALAESCGRK